MPDAAFHPGLAQHTVGWPFSGATRGGGFMYHFGDHYVAIGLVTHLNYKNPWTSPFDEFQRYKHHPAISRYLEGGKRIAYGGAKADHRGRLAVDPQADPFPGGALIGCSGGLRERAAHQEAATTP